jgi:uncharacterized membrane protein YfcA
MDPLVIIFGFFVGLLVGMTGIGGGSIMTPLLILVVGMKPVMAIGTDLAYAAITKTLGGWRHLRQGTVDITISLWLAVGSIPGALGGVWVLERLHHAYGDGFDTTVLWIVAAALAVTGIATVGRALFTLPADRERETLRLARKHKLGAVAIGLGVGFVLGVSSAGSGALIAVGLILVFRLTPRRVVGTDVFHAAMLLWVASFAHVVAGNVDFVLTINLLLGSLPGVWIGSGAAVRVPEGVLRPALGIVLCTASAGLLIKAGVGIPGPVFVAVPLVLASLAWWLSPGKRLGRRSARPSPVPRPHPSAQRP